ncbi:DegV domain-containing protein [Anaerotignum neopropionicum]|uniref:DegV domain-containing protein n=1 Tax=Anaerotignum neopropionicum TaxID=36847 RepID=A0A136WFP2_9FIRM|nr:DegV family protein [Anaerotignum neopropionicum]KXL53277.1 DegV domain-containing protein [Anaerotignum neopropionicum]
MADYQIFSDGACDIGKEREKEFNISLVPFYVSLDHEKYHKEIEEISLDEYYKFMTEQNGFPKTSLPSVQDFIDAFRPVLQEGKDIICTTITPSLSSSVQSATTAKMMLEEEFPNAKIYVVNCWHITGSQTLILMEMAKMKRAGKTIDEVLEYVEKAKVDARIHFMVGGLSHLEVGGRIGKIAVLSGSILKIKPLIILKGGEISVGGAVRSRKKGLIKLADISKEHFKATGENPKDYVGFVGTTNVWDEVPEFEAVLKKALPEMEFIPSFQIGATVASHTGPGTIGFCFAKKYQAYHL